MPQGLDANRKGHGNLSARQVGLRLGQPTLTVGDMQLMGTGNQSAVFALPVDTTDWQPLQVVDPTSSSIGVLYFLPDVDEPGNPNRIIR